MQCAQLGVLEHDGLLWLLQMALARARRRHRQGDPAVPHLPLNNNTLTWSVHNVRVYALCEAVHSAAGTTEGCGGVSRRSAGHVEKRQRTARVSRKLRQHEASGLLSVDCRQLREAEGCVSNEIQRRAVGPSSAIMLYLHLPRHGQCFFPLTCCFFYTCRF